MSLSPAPGGMICFITRRSGNECRLLRKSMTALPPLEAMEWLIKNLHATKTNAELLLAGLR